MHLQKLVYFAHGWHLALKNQPLIEDEIQAWEFGPVIPNLYRALAQWGAQSVDDTIDAPTEKILPESEEVLEQVFSAYAKYSAATLSALTHKAGTPWQKVFEPGKRGLVIDNNIIADHFSELADRLD